MLVDEHFEENDEKWFVKNDNDAEWCIKVIAEERAESQRYINVCDTMINDYTLKKQKAAEQLKHATGYLIVKLQEYFITVPHKTTKTQETYKLPSGILKKKFGTPEYRVDNESLVKWLEANEFGSYIKTEKKAQWGELKKTVTISHDKVISVNGEIIDGITVNERPDNFEIEV